MIALDYNTVFNEASNDVQKINKGINLFGNAPFLNKFLSFIFNKWINKTFRTQLFMSSWLLLDIKKNYDNSILNNDWSKMINLINHQISINISLQSKIESDLLNNQDKDLEIVNKELEETISNLYSCLRLLKKATIKTIHTEPSEMAIIAAQRGANTINTIYAS